MSKNEYPSGCTCPYCAKERDLEYDQIESTEYRGTYFRKDVKDLGEFRFVFMKTPKEDLREGTNKYFMECFWNPKNYGMVDFVVGYYVEDIDDEIDRISDDMSYFIDGAKISCECRIGSDEDNEGMYEDILMDFFDYDECDICKIEKCED